MNLVGLLIVLVVIGVAMAFFPIDAMVRNIIYAVLAVLVLVIVLSMLGVFGGGVYVHTATP